MRFLYKIYTRYDGFTPARIPDRLTNERYLTLGWQRYLDVAEPGSEVWVYFHGPHQFQNGVYVKGFVESMDPQTHSARLRVREYSTDRPLTDEVTRKRIENVISVRGRQVFILPGEWASVENCTLDDSAGSCGRRLCGECAAWRKLTLIRCTHVGPPQRFWDERYPFVPAYWVIPSRCAWARYKIAREVHHTSELFYRFKTGVEALAFPLARGMYEALSLRRLLRTDCIVPIPLSPRKVAAGEFHRTRALARELGELLRAPVVEALSLNRDISKREWRLAGLSASSFERTYYDALSVKPKIGRFERVLLVDDACTHGSTLSTAVRRLAAEYPECSVTTSVAGQMIVKAVVAEERSFRNPR